MKRAAAVLFLALAAGAGAVDAAPPRLNAYCSTAAERRAAVPFRATDGARLVGVLLGPARSRAGVVLSHEGEGGLCNWLPYGRRLARLGYRVLVYDARGYGSSPLPRRRAQRYELDVAGAVRELRRRGVRRVVVAGGSMGAMSSLVAATTIRPRVDGVVAVSPASWRFRGLDPLRAAPRLSAPVLYIAAEEDGQFASDARTLHAATGSAEKQLVVVEGRGHGFELVTGAERAGVRESIETFLHGRTRTAARRTTGAVPGAESDVRLLERELERIHPNPFHAFSRENFRSHFDQLAARAASLERDQLIVELMRTMALLGERDGHSGLYTLHRHPQPLHLYPVRVYWFSDGLSAVGGADPGAKLVAIEGVPIDELVAKVRPLITRDNEWSLRERVPYYLVCAEVLRGLGVVGTGPATFTFASAAGRRDVELEPITAAAYSARFPFYWQQPEPPPGVPRPLWVRYRNVGQAVTTLQRGRYVYAAYAVTQDPSLLVSRTLRLARKPAFRRLIVDVRQNGGGNNATYGSLLQLLRNKWVVRRSRPVVLTGRTTFSAAGNFVAEVKQSTRARLVGEPPGGAANQWGDYEAVVLPNVGLEALVATVYIERGRDGDTSPTIEPHVRVELSSADWVRGRDPVLAASLR